MNETEFLSDETAELVAQIERELSVKEKLPDTAQVMAVYVVTMTTKVIKTVHNQLTNEAVVVALHQGKLVPIDFNSKTAITAEAVQHAREGLNRSGYSLLVRKVSRNHYKLFVGKLRAVSKRQSRLLWAAPSTVSFIIGLTWEKALQKLGGIFFSEDAARIQRQIFRKAAFDREYGVRSIDSLPEDHTGYTVPWSLKRNGNGSYWLDATGECLNRPLGTGAMEVKWTPEGPMVYLPKNFNYERFIKECHHECFATNQADFEWVLVNSEPR